MNLKALTATGHWPTLTAAFLYFDVSFMVWVLLGPLAVHISKDLGLSAAQKGMMVAIPVLGGALLRVVMGLMVDHIGPKRTGLIGQVIVLGALAWAWLTPLDAIGDIYLLGTLPAGPSVRAGSP